MEILAFPSQEFGKQEYSSNADIQAFANAKNFPGTVLQLGKVTGTEAPALWKFMQEQTGAKDPTWNFKGKFLVSKTGQVSVPTNVEADIEQKQINTVDQSSMLMPAMFVDGRRLIPPKTNDKASYRKRKVFFHAFERFAWFVVVAHTMLLR